MTRSGRDGGRSGPRGNDARGSQEQPIYTKIEMDKIKRTQGRAITIVTTANTNDEAGEFLKLMGMPFAEGR